MDFSRALDELDDDISPSEWFVRGGLLRVIC